MPTETRLQVVFADLRRAIDDVIGKHQVTPQEVTQTLGWIQQVADAGEFLQAAILFGRPALEATEGASYAHPEKDGASHWQMEGPAYIPDSPSLESPCVLPMRTGEPGEPLIVSGTVRSTSGDPLPGALLDVWQTGANSIYSGLMTEDFLPFDIPNDSTGIPEFNLRGRITADSDGRYEFRTIMPGVEHLGFKQDGSPVTTLIKALELEGVRPPHIHAMISAEGFHTLITQAYFDGDPLVNGTVEGHLPPSAVKATIRHDDPADYHARGLSEPYRTLTYDYVLRPITPPVPVRGGLKGFEPRP